MNSVISTETEDTWILWWHFRHK